jgi:hypothetical protein
LQLVIGQTTRVAVKAGSVLQWDQLTEQAAP